MDVTRCVIDFNIPCTSSQGCSAESQTVCGNRIKLHFSGVHTNFLLDCFSHIIQATRNPINLYCVHNTKYNLMKKLHIQVIGQILLSLRCPFLGRQGQLPRILWIPRTDLTEWCFSACQVRYLCTGISMLGFRMGIQCQLLNFQNFQIISLK